MSILAELIKEQKIHTAEQLTPLLCGSEFIDDLYELLINCARKNESYFQLNVEQFFGLAGLRQLSADKDGITYALSLSTERGTRIRRYRVLRTQQAGLLQYTLMTVTADSRFVAANVRGTLRKCYIDRNKQPKYNIHFTWG